MVELEGIVGMAASVAHEPNQEGIEIENARAMQAWQVCRHQRGYWLGYCMPGIGECRQQSKRGVAGASVQQVQCLVQ